MTQFARVHSCETAQIARSTIAKPIQTKSGGTGGTDGFLDFCIENNRSLGLAWPGVVIFLVFKFRERFGSLLDRLTEATLPGGFSGKFGPGLAKAAEALNEVPRPPEDEVANVVGGETAPQDTQALRANPSGVIMETWQAVIAQGRELLETKPSLPGTPKFRRAISDDGVFSVLRAEGLATPEEMKVVDRIRDIRNNVAHSRFSATSADAAEYLAIAERLILSWVVRIANIQRRE